MSTRNSWAWRKLRQQRLALARTNNEPCCRCGQPIDYALSGASKWGPTCDHLDPTSQGHPELTTPDRLGPAHRQCNISHGGKLGATKTNQQRRQPITAQPPPSNPGRQVILLCGPPAAGKSTHARTLGLQVFDLDDPHYICWHTARVRAADYTRALIAARATHEANQRIANDVRGLLLPGVKRKVIRIEELRNIVAMADAPRTMHGKEMGE
jgi:hypothetical protein